MRLFEVEDRFTNDLILVLRNLEGRSDSKREAQALPWAAVNNMLTKLGYSELDTGSLAKLVKQSPALNLEIKTFDDDTGVVLNTKAEKEKAKTQTPTAAGPSVDAMAHQAANYKPQLS
jgi:hypothetical protein